MLSWSANQAGCALCAQIVLLGAVSSLTQHVSILVLFFSFKMSSFPMT